MTHEAVRIFNQELNDERCVDRMPFSKNIMVVHWISLHMTAFLMEMLKLRSFAKMGMPNTILANQVHRQILISLLCRTWRGHSWIKLWSTLDYHVE